MILEVMHSNPAFGYEKIAVRSIQTECMYSKIIKILSTFILLCSCASLCAIATERVPSFQPSLTPFSSFSFCGKESLRAIRVDIVSEGMIEVRSAWFLLTYPLYMCSVIDYQEARMRNFDNL